MIAFDKTGTVTKGQPAVAAFQVAEHVSEDEIMQAVYAMEKQSSHPLAKAIAEFAESRGAAPAGHLSIDETSGFGVQAEIEGVKWMVGKAGFAGKDAADAFFADIGKRIKG